MTLIVDTHTHYAPPAFRAALLSTAARDPGFAREHRMRLVSTVQDEHPANRLDLREQQMREAGVDHCLISLPPPAASFGEVGLAREANDELLDVAAASGGRLSVLLSLPLTDAAAALAELRRLAGARHVAGVQVLASGASAAAVPDRAEQVLAAISAAGLPVVLHPAIEPMPAAYDDYLLEASLAPVTSSSVAAARLVLSGLMDRLPDLQVVVPHLGGVLPYVAQRLSDFGRGHAQHDLTHYLQERLWFDTCSFHPPAFRCAVETVTVERLMLGSDYPVRGPLARAVQDVRAQVPERVAQAAVLGGTACALFPSLTER